jgi:hypothetical protein
LVTLSAGVNAQIKNVALTITNVRAQVAVVCRVIVAHSGSSQADLTVRLTNVYKIVARALDTLDKNPAIVTVR